MSLTAAIIANVALDLSILGTLAYVMTRPMNLRPHFSLPAPLAAVESYEIRAARLVNVSAETALAADELLVAQTLVA